VVHSLAGIAEPVSALSHLLAAVLAVVMSTRLYRRSSVIGRPRAALLVFGLAVVLQLFASALFHALPLHSTGRAVLQRIDHGAIYILIAATFTPIHVYLLDGVWRWLPLAAIWTVALAGATLQAIYFSRIPEGVSLSVYLAMGWMGLFGGWRAARVTGWRPLAWLLAGGISYSAGALVDYFESPILIPGVVHAHELFHLAVLGGIASHWIVISSIGAGRVRGARNLQAPEQQHSQAHHERTR
jgi:channel protein (hemolysin III family)